MTKKHTEDAWLSYGTIRQDGQAEPLSTDHSDFIAKIIFTLKSE
jgi:hypothetical protein